MHRRLTSLLLPAVALAGLVPFVHASPAAAAGSASYTVTTTDDVVDAGDGLLSLREAFTEASSDFVDSEVVLAQGATYHLTLCDAAAPEHENVDGDLDVLADATSLTLTGNDATIDQDCAHERVLYLDQPAVVRHVTITGGDSTGNVGDDLGGGIVATDTLTIEDSAVVGNTAQKYAVQSRHALSFVRSTLAGNTGVGGGSGLMTSTIGSDVTVVDATVTGNQGVVAGPLQSLHDIVVRNSTVSGNTTTGANIYGAQMFANGTVRLDHATVVDNALTSGQTIYGLAIEVGDSILVNPDQPECAAANSITSLGQNVVEDTSCGSDVTDTIVADPELAPLADNGGPTLTRRPLAGSPALDIGPCSPAVITDQRGLPRPTDGCDAGAVEVQHVPDALLRLGTRPFRGDGVHNTTGQGQSYRAVVARNGTATFVLGAQNDGEVADTLHLKGGRGRGQVTARYTRAGHDLTASMTAGRDVARPVHTQTTVTVRIHVGAHAPHGLVRRFPLTVTSSGAVDRVVATIQVR